MPDKFIFGCGYLGKRVAQLWQQRQHTVSLLTRSEQTSHQFSETGLHPVVGDVTNPESLKQLPECDTILYSIGFDRTGQHTKREVYVDGLRNALREIKSRCRKFIYISSTSVYGETDGSWVDETTPTQPQSEGGQICLEAEQLVESELTGTGVSHHILRLAGIYGPNRLLRKIELLQQQLPLTGNPDAWLNLTHADDAAQVILKVDDSNRASPLYLIADDEPMTRQAYYEELARQVHMPEPVFDPTQPGVRTRGLNKRCRNQRVKSELALQWQFPNYRTGLSDAVSRSDFQNS